MVEPDTYTRSRIGDLVDRALCEAGVAGTIPTPLEAVRDVLGIPEPAPIAELDAELRAARPALLGAFSYTERRMYVEERQSAPRRRFTEAHELVHALCPWHHAVLRLDTCDELFRPVRAAIEREANLGAGLLIFQGRQFARRLPDEPPSIAAALRLAGEHGASAHATLRHYVEMHPTPTALLTLGRFPLKGGGLPLWSTVESPVFRARFGRLMRRLGNDVPRGSSLHELAEAGRAAGLASGALQLRDRGGRTRRLAAEAYYNRHSLLVLLGA
jgi:hypothetical protein